MVLQLHRVPRGALIMVVYVSLVCFCVWYVLHLLIYQHRRSQTCFIYEHPTQLCVCVCVHAYVCANGRLGEISRLPRRRGIIK